jgi:hypothetical protein
MAEENKNTITDEILIKDAGGKFSVLSTVATQAAAKASKLLDENLALADKIAQELNLQWSDEILERRFKNIILANLKDIRNEVQTHDALTKGVEVGGLSLAEDKAQAIIRWLKKQKGEVLPAIPAAAPAATPVVKPQPAPVEISATTQKPTPSKVERPAYSADLADSAGRPAKPFTQAELDHELAPPPPAPQPGPAEAKILQGLEALVKPKEAAVKAPAKTAAATPVAAESDRYLNTPSKPFITKAIESEKSGIISALKEKLAPAAAPVATEKTVKSASSSGLASGREKITDIKVPSRLVGPIDELQNFRLVDFRQLNSDPLKACLKIKDKIDLLENQSFSKKIEGVNAWQKSEVNRLYLTLGKESVEQGKSLEEVIKVRTAQGQISLSKEEFLALGKLNKMLEY